MAPARQRRGIGAAQVRDGLRGLAAEGMARVLVLGDPAYCGRLGFCPDAAIAPPHPLPDAWRTAWQGLDLDAAAPRIAGRLDVPVPWRDKALWGA